ncbi:uncharacterized protein [Battus philenor]|uniref:uncharacterized protein n=1 Tax=Battus philenor TaxID=42288 RepID=UPI0035D07C66
MIALKKWHGDELLRLALVLSLLKARPDEYLQDESQQLLAGLNISNGSDWAFEPEARTLIRPRFVHPKSLDNILINYERRLFEELHSLGRYADYTDTSARSVLHTYLLNDVSTDTVAPTLQTQDAVSADDNVAHEVKVDDDEPEAAPRLDSVVTLSPDLHNRTESDVFAEIATRSFDVNDFLIRPEMQIKEEPDDDSDDLMEEVRVKKESDDDLYSDNAIDDFVPYFTAKSEKLDADESHSVYHQNLADLRDYEMFEDIKELRSELDLDIKQQEDLEQYLLENTPLDAEVYELAPMLDDEPVFNVKRERASTSFTSASSSGVSEMDSSSKDGLDVKLEPDEGHHSGDELTQEDMDLIEVLWKQDVDMGFSLEDPVQPEGPQATKVELGDEIDKELKLAEEKIQKKKEETEKIEKVKASLFDPEPKEDDPWAGLSYTVDTETGKYYTKHLH